MALRKVIISGGGTGGHIYPALAIAEEIKQRFPEVDILFVGAIGRMEMEKIPAEGYPIEGLWITGIERKIFSKKNLSFPFKLISSLTKAKTIIKKFKPEVVIGVGGFASGPLLHVASKLGIPTLIQEQNSFPGITNRILAKKVDRICTGFDNMNHWFPKAKTRYTGNPIRMGVLKAEESASNARAHFSLDENKPTVFIMGGSLGAASINKAVQIHLAKLSEAGIQVLWQTGKRYLPEVEAWLAAQKITGVVATDFISRMDLAYIAADVIVSRAGAMSIAELAIVGKPCVLVPSPNVSEDHQTKNALSMTESGAAILLKDQELDEKLGETLHQLMTDKSAYEQMASAMKKLARPKAAAAVVDEIIDLCKA